MAGSPNSYLHRHGLCRGRNSYPSGTLSPLWCLCFCRFKPLFSTVSRSQTWGFRAKACPATVMALAETIEDEDGMCYCKTHRRELCHECMVNFTPTNKILRKQAKGKDVNTEKIIQKHAEKSQDVLRAMALAQAEEDGAEAGSRPIEVSGAAAQGRYEQIAETCAACGKKGKVQKCSKCKSVAYCGKECQLSDWGDHKKKCKRIAKQIENEQWSMGGVPVLPPGHPRWGNPTEEDKALARRMLAQGKTPEEVTNSGNPMLGGWMLGLEIEAMMQP
eukprot:2961202-Rhodomonas_salina.1